MHASRLSRRAVLAGTTAAAALTTVPPLQGRAHATGVTAATPSYSWDERTARWTPLTDHLGWDDWNLLGVESLAVDPAHPDRLYLALGAYAQAWAGNGAVLRSEDRGATWTRTGSTETITAVYRSDDAAGTWVRINDDAHQWGWIGETITGDPRLYGRVYLGTNGRGIQYADCS